MNDLDFKAGSSKNYLVVEGSNISAVNGLYVKSNIINGKYSYAKFPKVNYLHPGPFGTLKGNFIIYWRLSFGGQKIWILETEIDYPGSFYSSTDDVISPDLIKNMSISQNGNGLISIRVAGIKKNLPKKIKLSNKKINLN